MDSIVVSVFAVVYLGMILGTLPGLALNRAGVALLGAIALLATGKSQEAEVWRAIDFPTLALLFGFMILSAQFRLSGFYSWLVRHLSDRPTTPQIYLALLIVTSAALSAFLANDIICLAITPIVIESCSRLQYNPKPFLIALACSANIGSAATLIGNPQNMLIGQVMHLPFGLYTAKVLVPVVLSLAVLWGFVAWLCRHEWRLAQFRSLTVAAPDFNRWQTTKGMVLLGVLIMAFLVTPWPRELMVLVAAGLLLCSRRMQTSEILGQVDWQLLTLFIGLFILNRAFADTGGLVWLYQRLEMAGIQLSSWPWLLGISTLLSNLVSNVPAVMLLLPAASGFKAGTLLALSSTLAGNLFIVGSIANIIVVEQAAKLEVKISWWDHARLGVPITLATLVISALWFWIFM